MSTVKQLRQTAIRQLKGHSPTAQLDVDLLLQHVLKCSAVSLITQSNEPLSDAQIATVEALLARRKAGEPIAYIIGHKSFMGLDFSVDGAVLIPRPDTEVLVEKILADSAERPLCGADIGTGSGAIAIALLCHAKQLTMWASDISAAALQLAAQNAAQNGVTARLKLLQSDLFAAYGAARFDFIVSNPPYIDKAQYQNLAAGVKDYEPRQALYGGDDGLDYYRQIVAAAPRHLKRGATLYFEIGYDQRLAVVDILRQNGFSKIDYLTDLAGKDRVVYGKKE